MIVVEASWHSPKIIPKFQGALQGAFSIGNLYAVTYWKAKGVSQHIDVAHFILFSISAHNFPLAHVISFPLPEGRFSSFFYTIEQMLLVQKLSFLQGNWSCCQAVPSKTLKDEKMRVVVWTNMEVATWYLQPSFLHASLFVGNRLLHELLSRCNR